MYIASSHKLWYMLLGTKYLLLLFLFFFRVSRVLGGVSRSYLTFPCLLMTTDMYCIFRINSNICNKILTTPKNITIWV